MKNSLLVVLMILIFSSCSRQDARTAKSSSDSTQTSSMLCDDDCMSKNSKAELKCKMTTEELQKRRETVLASLKKKVVKKYEIENGYSFQLPGDNATLRELEEFIKTEKECCDFLKIDYAVRGDQNMSMLYIEGPEGVKDFINAELGM